MNTPDPNLTPSPDDPLDQLLRHAAWPEPSDELVARLESQWRTRVQADHTRRRRKRLAGAVLAASVLVAAALSVYVSGRVGNEQRLIIQEDRAPVENVTQSGPRAEESVLPSGPLRQQIARPADEDTGTQVAADAESRPARLHEQVIFRVLEQRRPSRDTMSERDTLLEEAIAALSDNPKAEVNDILRPLLNERLSYEERLLRHLPQSSMERRLVQIRLLERLGSARSVPALEALSRHPQLHAPAIEALCALADPITLGRLVTMEQSTVLRQRVLAALLGRNDLQATAIYLNFVRRPETKPAALYVLKVAPNPPVDALFHLLDSPDYAQRMAAAVALGRLENPAVVERLIAMVRHDVKRQEALVALLNNSGEDATRFVGLARHNQLLIAAVRSAEVQARFAIP